jgi:hypothetical protein
MTLRKKIADLLNERISKLELLNALEIILDEETKKAYNLGLKQLPKSVDLKS